MTRENIIWMKLSIFFENAVPLALGMWHVFFQTLTQLATKKSYL